MSLLIDLNRYVGRLVELVYMDRSGRLTQRRVEIRSFSGSFLHVYCLERQSPRTLRVDSILAALPLPAVRRAV